jgi:hypothetical protein
VDGISLSVADAIVQDREEHGAFTDLGNVGNACTRLWFCTSSHHPCRFSKLTESAGHPIFPFSEVTPLRQIDWFAF